MLYNFETHPVLICVFDLCRHPKSDSTLDKNSSILNSEFRQESELKYYWVTVSVRIVEEKDYNITRVSLTFRMSLKYLGSEEVRFGGLGLKLDLKLVST